MALLPLPMCRVSILPMMTCTHRTHGVRTRAKKNEELRFSPGCQSAAFPPSRADTGQELRLAIGPAHQQLTSMGIFGRNRFPSKRFPLPLRLERVVVMLCLWHCPLQHVWTCAGHSSTALGIDLGVVLHSLYIHRRVRQPLRISKAADATLHSVLPGCAMECEWNSYV